MLPDSKTVARILERLPRAVFARDTPVSFIVGGERHYGIAVDHWFDAFDKMFHYRIHLEPGSKWLYATALEKDIRHDTLVDRIVELNDG